MSTSHLPSGTVTFLFTDIEGSTRLLQTLGTRYAEVLEEQRRLLRSAFHDAHGYEVGTQGDSFFVVFARAKDAVATAVSAQRAIASHRWPDGAPVKVRMGIHTGEGILSGDDYVGLDVHRAARISSVGYGGQILLSQATRVLIENDPPDGVTVHDLGPHRLKDLQRPEHLFEVVHPDLPSDFPVLRSLNALPNNLPVQLTSFVGREHEMAEIKSQLAATRLLTLLGPGGAGKTRLALQVAAECLDILPDGVWLAELAPITDPALVPQTVASTLGLREPGRPALESLVDFLRPRSLMLVLDNCEHLLTASAELCDHLLRHSRGVRILATSREALGVSGEHSYHIPPLALPEPDHPASPEGMSQYAAIRLFIERAIQYRSGFTITQGNMRAVAEICRRLDGIPLAIELAAARVKVLSVDQIAERLGDRFRLLTGGARSGLPHHQTLRAAMDWSHDLLSDEERRLFRRLSVFVGGFTLEAAEGACAGDGLDALQILDVLAHLVDKSLVLVDERAGDDARYRLLETVRQYALDRLLESGEAGPVRDWHRGFFLNLAERAELELHGPEQQAWLERLEVEHDNFRAAFEWSRAETGSAEAGLRLAGALWWFWEVRGYWTEARQWLRDLLARADGASAASRVKALNAAGALALRQGAFEEAGAMAEESLTLSKELGDKRAEASCLVIMGIQACRLEDYRRAEALGGESLTLAREAGDNWGTTWAQFILGQVARAENDHERAKVLFEQSMVQIRALGHQWGLAMVVNNLGLLARDQGQYEQAMRYFEEALALFEQLGDKSYIAYTQLILGSVACALDDYGRAGPLFRECLTLRRDLQDRRGIATCLAALACTAAGLGQFERAAVLFGEAEARREATGATIPGFVRDLYDRQVAATSRTLGDAALARHWSVGRAMPVDQAIDLALAGEAERV